MNDVKESYKLSGNDGYVYALLIQSVSIILVKGIMESNQQVRKMEKC